MFRDAGAPPPASRHFSIIVVIFILAIPANKLPTVSIRSPPSVRCLRLLVQLRVNTPKLTLDMPQRYEVAASMLAKDKGALGVLAANDARNNIGLDCLIVFPQLFSQPPQFGSGKYQLRIVIVIPLDVIR